MSDIDHEFTRVRSVLERPTLRLMSRPTSAAVIAVFRTVFDRDVQYVPADRMHLQVEEHILRLQELGARVPAIDHRPDEGRSVGRSLCREWVADRWLVRSNDTGGDEQYSLTSHALEALSLIDSLSDERALISESRLTMIVDAVHRWALRAEPDREVRIRTLDARIAELTAERQRLRDGGEITVVAESQMRDGYTNLIDLIRQLPSDFKRVEEAVASMHRTIVEDFRNEVRPIAEILDDYLARTDSLMESTPEGRAFGGAFELLRDDRLLQQLRDDIATVLSHRFADGLSAAERRAFRNTVAILRQGIEDVLTQRRQLTSTLRDQIVAHDVAHDRELDAVLRSLNRRLAAWTDDVGAHARVPVDLLPPRAAISTLQQRLYDPDAERALDPIAEPDAADHADDVDVSVLRAYGGPLLDELRHALDSAPAGAGSDAVFNALPARLRRPVDLFGLVHLLGDDPSFDDDTTTATHTTVRPNGEPAVFGAPVTRLGTGGDPAGTPSAPASEIEEPR